MLFAWSSSVIGQVNIGGVVNTYKPVLSIDSINCVSTVNVSNTIGLNNNDRIVVIQMNGSIIDSSNSSNFGSILNYNGAGNFEIVTIQSINGNELILDSLLTKFYDPLNGNVQIVSFPEYTNPTVTSLIYAQPWNGVTGGIVAFDVVGTLTMNANIDLSGQGFRGGSITNNPDGGCGTGSNGYYYPLTEPSSVWQEGGAEKGEGIAMLSDSKMAGKGALANGGGGGNKHNHGGGGGGNHTSGGKGGNALAGCFPNTNGGLGGLPLITNGNRLFLGGGGGSGDDNDNVGSPGTNGGGIVIIRANEIIGNNNSIIANGVHQTIIGSGTADGAGGGGAGGSILLDVQQFTSSINIQANGGNGGDQNPTWGCVGPGGGGGAGIITSCNPAIPSNVNMTMQAGNAGMFLNASFAQCANTTYGSADGTPSTLVGYLLIDSCLVYPDSTIDCEIETEIETEIEIELEIPNVFTPNNDGSNELFVPIISRGIIAMNTIIYNRWGNKIFETNNLLIEWNGQGVSDGTYFWIIYYTDITGSENNINGHLTILR
jgi:gliding motility-associated-like protein